MKKVLLNKALVLLLVLSFSDYLKSQSVIDFEDLTVPESGFFNGSTLHSGIIGSTETFEYYSGGGIFKVTYTLEDGYDYWSGTAYSNQTNLSVSETPWTNFSAYANYPGGGGANCSSNYGFSYMWNPGFVPPFSDTIRFNIPVKHEVHPEGIYVANTVWNYHYMNGTDGSGNEYSEGDYYKLTFRGLLYDGSFNGNEVEFFLADFTNGNSYIIDDWTFVDLTELYDAACIEIVFSSSDDWTPSYFCFDDLSLDYIGEINDSEVYEPVIFPNPTSDFINISNVVSSKIIITDISGKHIFNGISETDLFIFEVTNLVSGIYFVRIENKNGIFNEKFIKN